MAASLNRAHGQRIDHQPYLGSGLDGEEPGYSIAHRHILIKGHANRAVPPFPD
jgi:hypothetical protein